MTFKDFIYECENYEYSNEYYVIMKESAEISLMENYIANQEYLKESVIPDSISEGYFSESVDNDRIQQIMEAAEEKKEGLWNKIKTAIVKAWGVVVNFFKKLFSKPINFINKNFKPNSEPYVFNKNDVDTLISSAKLNSDSDSIFKQFINKAYNNHKLFDKSIRSFDGEWFDYYKYKINMKFSDNDINKNDKALFIYLIKIYFMYRINNILKSTIYIPILDKNNIPMRMHDVNEVFEILNKIDNSNYVNSINDINKIIKKSEKEMLSNGYSVSLFTMLHEDNIEKRRELDEFYVKDLEENIKKFSKSSFKQDRKEINDNNKMINFSAETMEFMNEFIKAAGLCVKYYSSTYDVIYKILPVADSIIQHSMNNNDASNN